MKQTILCEKLFKDFSSYFENHLSAVGLDIALIQQPNVEIPERKFVELLELVSEHEHRDIGLLIGSQLLPEHIGALGHATVNAENVEQGIRNIVDYAITYSHFANIDYCITDDKAEISYQISDPTILNKKQDAEFAIAAINRMLSLCANQPLQLISVYFEHSKDRDLASYQKVFNCPIYFDAPISKLVLAKQSLEFASESRDSRLYDILTQHLTEEKKRRNTTEFQNKLSYLIASQLSAGEVSIHQISKLYGVSVRTLQRRLDEHGLDYSHLLESIRVNLAKSYLKESTLSLSKISQQLGYKESSSFSRAFKRSQGQTPKEYRQSLLNS